MKKHNKRNDEFLIDLNGRGNIRIIRYSKKDVSLKDMQEFENRLISRYNAYCEFTELCIKQNIEKNQETITTEVFKNEMESMLEQNSLLKDLLKHNEQDD